MTSKFHSLTALSATALLSMSLLGACASTPDPAKVCTTEWISERSDKAIDSIQDRAQSSLKAMRKASSSLAEGKAPGLFKQLALLNALNGMKKELTRGQGIKDLKTVAQTCNDPNIVKDAMHGLMQRNGMSEKFITSVESNPIYQSLISNITAPEPLPKPNG